MGDEIQDIFVRQRRNLMAMSLVLVVADIENDVHLGPTKVFVHAPFTIKMVLWIVWAYWLWRYYTSFHDLGEKGFLSAYRLRLQKLGERIGIKRIVKGDREEYKKSHELFMPHKNEGRQLIVFNSYYGVGTPSASRVSINLRLGMKDPEGVLAVETFPPEQAVILDGLHFYFTAARAWAYVVFRTTLFTEYLLPFVFAFATAGYGIYVWAFHPA